MLERRKTCKKYFRNTMLENPNPDATFFAYVKLLISLLNGALFRLGENFSVRGHGARFFAEKNFASDEKFAGSIFWSGATGQDFSRSNILQAMKSLPQVFFWSGATGQAFWRRTISQAMFCPGLRGKIFVRGYGARFLAGKNCASDEKVFSGIFFTKTRTPKQHFLFVSNCSFPY